MNSITTLNIPEIDREVQEFWEKNDIFKKSIKMNNDLFNVQDGPPFANGIPHHGHSLVSTVKDFIGRRKTQEGKKVIRINGVDCHGVPIEQTAIKELNEKNEDFMNLTLEEKIGVCANIVDRNINAWPKFLKRLGRWSDYDNQYATKDTKYMETVWWVSSQLFKKGLIYRAKKVSHYSPGLATTLSNFESTLNMTPMNELTITVGFELISEQNTYILAWTTTPWTIPANTALCVNKDYKYVVLYDKNTNRNYIVSQDVYDRNDTTILPDFGIYSIVKTIMGSELVGLKYIPPFDCNNSESDNKFIIVTDPYVKTGENSGTGIVHLAPAYGEDDMRICIDNKIIDNIGKNIFDPLNEKCLYNNLCPLLENQFIKDKETEKTIVTYLLKKNALIHKFTIINKDIPLCWRTNTHLIYRAVESWFVATTNIKDDMLKNNEEINWYPNSQKVRMEQWLSNTRDWCISRNRWWGNPLNFWISDDGEIFCPESVKELEKYLLIPQKITDLHLDHVDNLEVIINDKIYKRTLGVFDCWFESGSAPYGQLNYPFDNQKLFKSTFPVDFINESQDQVRGWFYTLHVIATALFNKPAFKNVLVTGLVLNKEGKKYSKKDGGGDSLPLINMFGADAFRLYITNSPVVKAGTICFNDNALQDINKVIVIPLWSAYTFFTECVINYMKTMNVKHVPKLEGIVNVNNNFDVWILSNLQIFINKINIDVSNYDLSNLTSLLAEFIDKLNNWYIKMNRQRFKNNCLIGLATLWKALYYTTIYIAPLMPHITEKMYQNLKCYCLKSYESVHLVTLDTLKEFTIDHTVLNDHSVLKNVITQVRNIRDKQMKSTKNMIDSMTLYTTSVNIEILKSYENYILDETNISDIIYVIFDDDTMNIEYCVNNDKLKEMYHKDIVGKIMRKIKLDKINIDCNMCIENIVLTEDVLNKIYTPKPKLDVENLYWNYENDCLVTINKNIVVSDILMKIKDVYVAIQKMRKDAKIHMWDKIYVNYTKSDFFEANNLMNIMKDTKGKNREMIKNLIDVLNAKFDVNMKKIVESECSDIKLELWM